MQSIKAEDDMWAFMVKNAGSHGYDLLGSKVFAYADVPSDNPAKNKAVRKCVRAIIEFDGRNGKEVKKDMETDYGTGDIWYKDEQVAKWSEEKKELELLGSPGVAVAFRTLMGDK